MKRVFLFLLVVFILTACGEKETDVVDSEAVRKEPPRLTVISNDQKVTAVQGTYSWSYDNGDGTMTHVEADTDIPPRIVSHQSEPLKTDIGSEVHLDFAEDPDEVRINIWDHEQVERSVDVEDMTFVTDETGQMIYEIYGKWEQGSAHYVVKINVE